MEYGCKKLGIDLWNIFAVILYIITWSSRFPSCFEGRGRRVLYFSPRNPETQGEDEQRGQEEKEEIQNKMCINVKRAFPVIIDSKRKKTKQVPQLHFVHYTKLLASSEYRMDPYSTCFLKWNKLYFSFGASYPKVLVPWHLEWLILSGGLSELVFILQSVFLE